MIKSKELQPTKENLLLALEQDLFDRNKKIWNLGKICSELEDHCSIAIDADWGQGKTFFVKELKLLLDAYNFQNNSLSDEEKKQIKKAFEKYSKYSSEKEIELDSQMCIYYDAWKNDNDLDPILSILHTVLENTDSLSITEEHNKNIKNGLKGILSIIGKNKYKEILDLLEKEDFLDEIKKQRKIDDSIAQILSSINYERGNRLVIIIDELDRCKPSYALQLLERVKHYFWLDNITFIFSTNIKELEHTINKYYGSDYSACKYLERFFDYRMTIQSVKMDRYYDMIGLNDYSHLYDRVCRHVREYMNLSIRNTEKFYRMAKIACGSDEYQNYHDDNPILYAHKVSLCFFLPICIGLMMFDTKEYQDFIDGNNCKIALEILGQEVLLSCASHYLLMEGEIYLEGSIKNNQSVSLKNRIEEAYRAIFISCKHNESSFVNIGKCRFTNNNYGFLMESMSLLEDFNVYGERK